MLKATITPELDKVLTAALPPSEELWRLIELGYASRRRSDKNAAGMVDVWLSKQPFVVDRLRQSVTPSYGRGPWLVTWKY
jgi:hypothetical protein